MVRFVWCGFWTFAHLSFIKIKCLCWNTNMWMVGTICYPPKLSSYYYYCVQNAQCQYLFRIPLKTQKFTNFFFFFFEILSCWYIATSICQRRGKEQQFKSVHEIALDSTRWVKEKFRVYLQRSTKKEASRIDDGFEIEGHLLPL